MSKRKKIKPVTSEELGSIGISLVSEKLGDGSTMTSAVNRSGDYVGCPEIEPGYFRFWVDHGIVPEKAQPEHNCCSIGFSEKEQKWYGWSHRAIHGFGIGDKTHKGDAGVISEPGQACMAPVEYPRAGIKLKTLDDCKMAAIAFADAVS